MEKVTIVIWTHNTHVPDIYVNIITHKRASHLQNSDAGCFVVESTTCGQRASEYHLTHMLLAAHPGSFPQGYYILTYVYTFIRELYSVYGSNIIKFRQFSGWKIGTYHRAFLSPSLSLSLSHSFLFELERMNLIFRKCIYLCFLISKEFIRIYLYIYILAVDSI